ECLKTAENLAKRAIAAEPNKPDAYIYLASALGQEAHLIGMVRARLANIPSDAKAAIDHALMVAPNDGPSLAALGGWNIEVIHMGGRILGGMIYKADVQTGKTLFARALAADPANLIIPYEYALCLGAYDYDAEKSQIEALLAAVSARQPQNSYQTALRDRAAALAVFLAKADPTPFLAPLA